MRDNKRDSYNPSDKNLRAHLDNAEQTSVGNIDFLSNGFKLRTNDWTYNYTDTYIYMAFAEAPFKSGTGATTIEGTAR